MGIEIAVKKSFESYELDFQVKSDAKWIAILGASGSGKSLTLKSIAGVETPDSGSIVVGGRVLFDSVTKVNLPSRERKVGYLFQNYSLFPTMTVEENIGVGIKNKKNQKKIIEDYVKRYNLEGLKERYPHQLSGGQQQRVALARMMATEPEVILLDEPFSALDHHLREEMQRQLLYYLEDFAGTVILVSHDRDEVYRLSEELVILESGKSIAYGRTTELFEKPETVAAARLTGCKNIGRMADGQGCYVENWDLHFPVISVKAGCEHIGIRAHHIRNDKPLGQPYFVIPVHEYSVQEGLWEVTVSVTTSPQATVPLLWKVSKERWKELAKTELRELYLAEKDLLFLESRNYSINK